MENELDKSPRLFVENDLSETSTLPLDEKQAHYLKNVLRRADGSLLRVFNGRDGEFSAMLSLPDRKTCFLKLQSRLRPQPHTRPELHLIFAPIKKDRQDFMIEKAVELGATHFHPVLTKHSAIRDLNETRVKKQIEEAAEQCERLDMPQLHSLQKLENLLSTWPQEIKIYAGLERHMAEYLSKTETPGSAALLIGPEGGFAEEEKTLLASHAKITPVSLGDTILRTETAAIYGLGLLREFI